MKATHLINKLVELIGLYGDREIKIELLTDADSYTYRICGVDRQIEGEMYNHQLEFIITHDIEDVKEFKKNLK